MNAVKVGIIGFGRIGAEHLGWISQCPELSAVRVADVTSARRALAEARGTAACESVEDLLASDVDAVLVATPTAMHYEQAMAALAAGKHVMVEKPMALDEQQARQMTREAAGRGLVLSIFHNRRWDIDFLTVKKGVESGVFGRIINIESRLGQFGSCVGPAAREYRPNWRNERAFGGGGLYDWGSHFVDQMVQLMLPGRPVRVFAQLRGNVWSADCDDFARVLIDFDNGVAAMVEINTTTSAPLPRWHIDGTGGSGQSPHSPEFDTRVWARFGFVEAGREGPGPHSSGITQEARPALQMAEPGLSEMDIWRAFARAIRRGTPPAVTARSVLPTMAILDAARASAAQGRAVEISTDSVSS